MFLLNPPYGERLSDREGARALYRELACLSGATPAGGCAPSPPIPDLSAPLAAARIKKRRLYNGRLECDFFLYLSSGQD